MLLCVFLEQVLCAGSLRPPLTPRRLLDQSDLKEAGCPGPGLPEALCVGLRAPLPAASSGQDRVPPPACRHTLYCQLACLIQLPLNEPKARTLHCLPCAFPHRNRAHSQDARSLLPPGPQKEPGTLSLLRQLSLPPHFFSLFFLSLISPILCKLC